MSTTADARLIPMLASVGDEIPRGAGWTFEPKYDGIRVIAHARPTSVSLLTRNGIDRAAQFPEIAEALRAAAARRRGRLVVDGEIVALARGRPARFQALQTRTQLQDDTTIAQREGPTPAALMAFDLLADGANTLIARPWTDRRARLEARLAQHTTPALRLAESAPGAGGALLARARRDGWEGIMAKRMSALYRPGVRSKDWLKLKIEHRQEFVVGGYTDPRNSRLYFGALLLGYYERGTLQYAGNMGGGFTRAELKAMWDRLVPLARKTCPFASVPRTMARSAHWVRPTTVIEVKFNEWTAEGRLRQPTYVGTRDDKDASQVRREREHVL
jgi:bifunctional non-homologous end joining protein LigD